MFDLTVKKRITVIREGERFVAGDDAIVEAPLSIRLNGREAAVLLCTPEKMESLALGYLYSTGHLNSLDDLAGMRLLGDGITVEVELRGGGPAGTCRDGGGSPGCGGSAALSNVPVLPAGGDALSITADEIRSLMEELQERAALFKATGGAHSAALAGEGRILLFCEDVSRHNAVDKIIGEALQQGMFTEDKVLLCSCRLSLEIVLKGAGLRVPLLISRAAPTSLGIERAHALNMTLVGFVRGRRLSVYTHPHRVKA